MQNHKFEYVISGVELSAEQQAAISSAIASAVSGVLLKGSGGGGNLPIAGKVWAAFGGGRGAVNGGRLLFAATNAALLQGHQQQVEHLATMKGVPA
jgi:hypothetical protein